MLICPVCVLLWHGLVDLTHACAAPVLGFSSADVASSFPPRLSVLAISPFVSG